MNEAMRKYLASIGKKGGKAKSPAKSHASRENGKKHKCKVSTPAPTMAEHSAFMRKVRASLPSVTTEEAHAQARRVAKDVARYEQESRIETDEYTQEQQDYENLN